VADHSTSAWTIRSILVGKPEPMPHQGREIVTAIRKRPVEGPLYLGALNFEGDGQADLVNHGGRDKAVCVYSGKHYPYWEKELGRALGCGAFGENLTVDDMTEEDVCIGDIFQLGEAVVQVSQPRQPCYKLAARHGIPDLPLRVERTGFTGFYFRVLREGRVSRDSGLIRLARAAPGITVMEANRIMHRGKSDAEGIRRLLGVPELSDSWRTTLAKRLGRLEGPGGSGERTPDR